MKKIIVIVMLAAFLFTTAFASTDIDLSGMSLNELIELKNKINLAMWETKEWQEVKVPQGVYQVGVDIPAGVWTINATKGNLAQINISMTLDEKGTNVDKHDDDYHAVFVTAEDSMHYDENKDKPSESVELKAGEYLAIFYSAVTFTPYTGRPDLGFK